MVNELLFEQLFRMYYAELCRYASRYLSDKQIVEDIVQSFFIIKLNYRKKVFWPRL